jgi:hypothetical protein
LLNAHWFSGTIRVATVLALGSAIAPGVAESATSNKLLGALIGSVRDNGGIPQMGAIVQLFNRYDKPIERVLTNSTGEFGFEALSPDVYSIRVTLSSFMPALKRNIAVTSGSTSVLAINLASVLSSVELVYSSPASGALMSDDWKWVLRSSMATRPVLRIFDIGAPSTSSSASSSIFSGTRGVIKLSSGEESPFAASGNQPDLGTTFALATSLFGAHHLQVTGNIGYAAQSELPATGFRTSFSRGDMQGPAVKLTMQQVSLPNRPTSAVVGAGQANAPALRTMSLTFIERTEVADGIDFEYGASLDTVTFIDRLNYLSPFARLTYHLGDKSKLQMGYSSGAPPMELLQAPNEVDADLQRDMMALAVLPRVSLRGGQAMVQRSQNLEIGYEVELGSRTLSVSAFHESVGNGALTMSTPDGFYMNGDLLPELSSSSSVFNIGRYDRYGYTATLAQQLGDQYNAAVSYGRGGVLTTNGEAVLATGEAGELRQLITPAQRHWVRANVSGVAPVAGTRFAASYEWSGSQSLTPGHVYLTQRLYPETGLNVRVRQPLPMWNGLPGRVEATAEFRNMLAQGYLPISLADSCRLVLAHSPRAVRGGLSFIF